MASEIPPSEDQSRWRRFFNNSTSSDDSAGVSRPSKWSLGILNDKTTIEVPGSVLLLAQHRNEPLGLRNVHARTSHSSIPAGFPVESPRPSISSRPSVSHAPHVPHDEDESEAVKKTTDGTIILEPQPEDSANDPLNWSSWRRDLALLCLGFYCMLGGGMTPIIAAGFTDVAKTYDIEVETVSLTTGLYMMGLGVGSVIASPTAILYGKRPVYLVSAIIFIGTSLWAAWSPSFNSLLVARVFQGIAVSPVECLPSATIAEIFFLHERAFRIGIYTLLLLGGKNLVPLVSAAIIGRFGWRWVFWIVAMITGFGFALLFLFVPETFWDRRPLPKKHHASKRPSFLRRISSRHHHASGVVSPQEHPVDSAPGSPISPASPTSPRKKDVHVGFAPEVGSDQPVADLHQESRPSSSKSPHPAMPSNTLPRVHGPSSSDSLGIQGTPGSEPAGNYFSLNEKITSDKLKGPPKIKAYTHNLRDRPAKSFVQQLKPWHGRLNSDSWFKVMVRPFILFAYPAVLWSAGIYACSVGWLIVVSESIAMIYRNPDSYNFDALQTGLVYVSPFVGGILGTGVAGKISDAIVKAMARRNGGLYEPEYRLVMAIPILITTCVGLMGFGWSADERDNWIVPTVFFGILSFGCSLGSTTAITFCVDSYRQYAGEALVTLNFSKNILHGLVFSLFVTHWLNSDGPKKVYICIGIIQLILVLFTIPMYIFGKRLRMWTVRMNMMEKF